MSAHVLVDWQQAAKPIDRDKINKSLCSSEICLSIGPIFSQGQLSPVLASSAAPKSSRSAPTSTVGAAEVIHLSPQGAKPLQAPRKAALAPPGQAKINVFVIVPQGCTKPRLRLRRKHEGPSGPGGGAAGPGFWPPQAAAEGGGGSPATSAASNVRLSSAQIRGRLARGDNIQVFFGPSGQGSP